MVKLKRYAFITIILLNLCSCQTNEIVENYPSGKVKAIYKIKDSKIHGVYKEFYENGNLKKEVYYSEGIKDSVSHNYFEKKNHVLSSTVFWKKDKVVYQKNYFFKGGLKSEGEVLNDSLKIGKWDFYSQNGYKSEIAEFINLKNKSFLNQKWMINEQGDTIDGGNYYKLKMKDTVDLGKSFRVHFYLEKPVISYSSQLFVLLPKENSLKENFSNEDQIKWDTIENISQRFRNRKTYQDRNHDVIFDLESDKAGIKRLRGVLLEKSTIEKDSFDFVTRKMYFDIPYYVRSN